MTVLIKELYDALLEAGVSEASATAAAQALEAPHDEPRLRTIEKDIAELKSDVRLLKWMAGFNIALSVGILVKLLA
jgi:hypothetical protein